MAQQTALVTALRSAFPGGKILLDEPMSRHTSFAIGGPADVLFLPGSKEELVLALNIARKAGAGVTVMGNGSNLLVSDLGVRGLVIKTTEGLCALERAQGSVTAGSGVILARVAVFAREQGLAGLEFAHGIPGTVGGAVLMNAGAYGGEIAQRAVLTEFVTRDGQMGRIEGDEHLFSYRHSYFTDHRECVILQTTFALEEGDPAEIGRVMSDLAARRRASQPLEKPSAGSTFKRPEGAYAAALIEQCGLKGAREGMAQVSEKHAGFVVNLGGATCDDVRRLMARVQEEVLARTGIRLEPEVQLVGAFDLST